MFSPIGGGDKRESGCGTSFGNVQLIRLPPGVLQETLMPLTHPFLCPSDAERGPIFGPREEGLFRLLSAEEVLLECRPGIVGHSDLAEDPLLQMYLRSADSSSRSAHVPTCFVLHESHGRHGVGPIARHYCVTILMETQQITCSNVFPGKSKDCSTSCGTRQVSHNQEVYLQLTS